MMRSESTSAFGQPSETKLTEGVADWVVFLDRTVLSYRRSRSRSSCATFSQPRQSISSIAKTTVSHAGWSNPVEELP
jgi:hypothetical protein